MFGNTHQDFMNFQFGEFMKKKASNERNLISTAD